MIIEPGSKVKVTFVSIKTSDAISFAVLDLALVDSVCVYDRVNVCKHFLFELILINHQFIIKLEDSYLNIGADATLIFIILFFIWDPVILPVITDMIVYHIWLKCKGLSTYDHIVIKRKEKE